MNGFPQRIPPAPASGARRSGRGLRRAAAFALAAVALAFAAPAAASPPGRSVPVQGAETLAGEDGRERFCTPFGCRPRPAALSTTAAFAAAALAAGWLGRRERRTQA